MGISTKAGDAGNTQLLNGQTIRKDHPIAEVLGVCDELTTQLGLAKLYNKSYVPTINRIQRTLILLIQNLSSAEGETSGEIVKEIHFLDMLSEEYGHDIGGIKKDVVIPGENLSSTMLHMARVACRKLERRIVSLMDSMNVDKNVIKYINRLSDIIYLMALKTETEVPDEED